MAMRIVPGLDRVVLDHEQEQLAHDVGFKWMQVKNSHPTTQRGQYNRALNYHEMVTEKAEAMGLTDAKNYGWWLGMKINDDEQWELVKKGERQGFSIHGKGKRTDHS